MSYGSDREGLQRTGFRPSTNPWAATQLAGIFDPEYLRTRGLGQTRAFPRAGGYVLESGSAPRRGMHGLGAIVPNQSTVTWVGSVSGTAMKSVQDVISSATAALQADGLEVIGSSGMPFSIFDTDLMVSSSAQISLTILVNNGMGYSDPTDIAAIVNHEIYAASGVMPTGAITVVQPYGGTATSTAAAAGVPQPDATTTDMSAWIQQNATWIGLGLLGVVLIPVLLEKF